MTIRILEHHMRVKKMWKKQVDQEWFFSSLLHYTTLRCDAMRLLRFKVSVIVEEEYIEDTTSGQVLEIGLDAEAASSIRSHHSSWYR